MDLFRQLKFLDNARQQMFYFFLIFYGEKLAEKEIDKLGLSWAKLSSAGVKIRLVSICWGYGEKYSGFIGLRLTQTKTKIKPALNCCWICVGVGTELGNYL